MTSTLFGGCARVRSNQPKVLHPQFCIRSFKLPRCPTFALLTRKVDAIDSIFSASRLMHMNTVPSVMFILHPGPTRVNGTRHARVTSSSPQTLARHMKLLQQLPGSTYFLNRNRNGAGAGELQRPHTQCTGPWRWATEPQSEACRCLCCRRWQRR